MTIMTITKKRRPVPVQGMELWTVAEAKARFSDLVEKAKLQGPQTITRHGKFAAVLVSAEEWTHRSPRSGTLAEFLSQSPLRGSGLRVERSSDLPRKNGL
ncbi:MAG: type II toxin-antitoxin system Phd/YefM family antitoxin [Acidobacteriaceae bacterium]